MFPHSRSPSTTYRSASASLSQRTRSPSPSTQCPSTHSSRPASANSHHRSSFRLHSYPGSSATSTQFVPIRKRFRPVSAHTDFFSARNSSACALSSARRPGSMGRSPSGNRSPSSHPHRSAKSASRSRPASGKNRQNTFVPPSHSQSHNPASIQNSVHLGDFVPSPATFHSLAREYAGNTHDSFLRESFRTNFSPPTTNSAFHPVSLHPTSGVQTKSSPTNHSGSNALYPSPFQYSGNTAWYPFPFRSFPQYTGNTR